MEETKKVGNIILTIIVLLALGFGIYYLVLRNDADTVANEPVPGSDYYVSVVQVKHQFANGKHVYVGSLDLPSGCYDLYSSLDKVNDAQGTLELETEMNTEEMCTQAVTTMEFREEVDAPVGFTLTGTLNGRAIELNIYEVPADQDIDLFEINIKG